MKRNREETITDSRLKALLDEARQMQAPSSPWFTRKVMNRLPPRRVHAVAMAEYIVYIIAAIATVTFGVVYGIDTFESGVVTVGNLCVMGCSFGVLCAIAYLMISPWYADE